MAKLYSGKFIRKVGEEKVWQCNRGGTDGVYEQENIGREKNSTSPKNSMMLKYFSSNPSKKDINCRLLFQGDASEVGKALSLSKVV